MNGNMNDMMQAIQDMKEKVREMNVTVTSEDNSVQVIINGQQEIMQLNITPEAFEKKDAASLSAAVAETFDRALMESKKMMQEEIKKQSEAWGIPPIPGFF
ncbi:MAG: YbaB/EbfC family nucleoid-associated protein [Clostridiales bacterium]|nr:YbaB/EbfC family nucleoid-associated protein [Clostridiales bacterium]MCF8021553.1 YbaB/EbfC family nucleoid-associated protein [Clostridiales bacterium]